MLEDQPALRKRLGAGQHMLTTEGVSIEDLDSVPSASKGFFNNSNSDASTPNMIIDEQHSDIDAQGERVEGSQEAEISFELRHNAVAVGSRKESSIAQIGKKDLAVEASPVLLLYNYKISENYMSLGRDS